MAFEAMRASSWLSLISTLTTWTGRLYSPPLFSKSFGPKHKKTRPHSVSSSIKDEGSSAKSQGGGEGVGVWGLGEEDVPSHTASKHLSSHVTTTSGTVLVSCHRSGAFLIFRFRSIMLRIPLAVYLFEEKKLRAPVSARAECPSQADER